MPHCILEYSSNIVDRPDPTRLLTDIHEALASTSLFSLADIKSRIIRHDAYVVGDGAPERSFVTLNIQIFGGRSDEAKGRITDAATEVLKRAFPESLRRQKCSLTVQVSEIHRPSYRRHMGER